MKYISLAAFISWAVSPDVQSATVAASGVAYSKVLSAVNEANAGDTVTVPAGTATWSLPLIVNKAITLQGAGIGKTIIVDGLQADDNIIRFVTKSAKGEVAGASSPKYRLSGFEFTDAGLHPKEANGIPKEYLKGAVLFNGSTKNFRLDHCKFNHLRNRHAYFRHSVCGVIDHCVFVSAGTGALTINHNQWPNPDGSMGAWGDGSWAVPVDWGGPTSIYIEDNTFVGDPPGSVIDEYGGARFVLRYNTITSMRITSHGTGSTGRYRGVRQWEIYNNKMTSNPPSAAEAIHLRGGTGVIFNNAVSNYGKAATLHTYRYHTAFPTWSGSDGTSNWDRNDPTVYLSGTAATGSKNFTLGVAGANWTPNQWVGYTARDTAASSLYPKGFFSVVTSNTKNSITVEPGSQIIDKPFRLGDHFEIRKVNQSLDMIGGSTGNLLSSSSSPGPTWLYQAIEPAYVWNNTLNGVANAGVAIAPDPAIKSGLHYFNNKPKPNYLAYVHPHPLAR